MGGWKTQEARRAWQVANREKLNEQQRTRRSKNPERFKESDKRFRAKIDDIVYAAKDVPCKDCEQRFPLCAMQFDHVRGEKTADIAVLRSRGNRQKIAEEIAKCDVICANCHAIRTCQRDCRPKMRRCSHDE